MTVDTLEREFIRYSKDDINEIIRALDIDSSDATWLTAITTYAAVTDIGESHGMLISMPAVDVLTFEITGYRTGIYRAPGQYPIILLNTEEDILDYDFISNLHPAGDYEIYLWLSEQWEEPTGEDLYYYDAWYRSEVYKDYMPRYVGGPLQWPDLPKSTEEESDDTAE